MLPHLLAAGGRQAVHSLWGCVLMVQSLLSATIVMVNLIPRAGVFLKVVDPSVRGIHAHAPANIGSWLKESYIS